MRSSDFLSNKELRVLRFNSWDGPHFTRCTYLPVFCTAGKLVEAFNTARVLSEQGEYQSLNKRGSLERQVRGKHRANVGPRESQALIVAWILLA